MGFVYMMFSFTVSKKNYVDNAVCQLVSGCSRLLLGIILMHKIKILVFHISIINFYTTFSFSYPS